ncbi:hypothetical protein TIFTF001_030267 [Ficus carica]|uniref:Uncharacterized protein n=1 Tax=Ficus carica TaxID=3494 RepID=A0AA88J3X1_FICCA|nr:hypothetical protein TIFTF001_030267 [Ficus carica]
MHVFGHCNVDIRADRADKIFCFPRVCTLLAFIPYDGRSAAFNRTADEAIGFGYVFYHHVSSNGSLLRRRIDNGGAFFKVVFTERGK